MTDGGVRSGRPVLLAVAGQVSAEAGRDGLVAEGVSPSAISVTGKGESELLVQTGDGVKEPQNRRGTISLH